MSKKYNYKFARIASSVIAINNIKAADTNIYVSFNGKSYSETNNGKVKKSNLNSLKGLISELANLKDGNVLKENGAGEALDLAKISEDYFVKSVKIGDVPKLTDVSNFNITSETIDNDTNKLTVKLVKKENRINIKYNDATVKCGRLTKENEKKILESILQGKNNSEISSAISLTGLEFNFGGETQGDSTKVIGNDVNLFANENKVDFTITKLPATGIKTVVYTLAPDVKDKLIKNVKLELLSSANDITVESKKLADEINALNAVQVDDANVGIFKNDAVLTILPNGDEANKLSGDDKLIPANCKFILIKDIKEADINPKFLKKTFEVKFDNTDPNKAVNKSILDNLARLLKTMLENNITISSKDIFTALANSVGNINSTFSSNIIINEGQKDVNDTTDLATNTNKFDIKLPAEIFASNVVTSSTPTPTPKLTCIINEINRGSKKLKDTSKTMIKDFIDRIPVGTTLNDFITKFNNDTIKRVASKNFAAGNFDFSEVSTDSNTITKGGEIKFNESFWDVLNDVYFEDSNPTITLTCNFNNVTKNNKKLTQNIQNAINGILSNLQAGISKTEFVKLFNDDTNIQRKNGQNFVEGNFNFTNLLTGNNITKGGEIKFNASFWDVLSDEHFEEKKEETTKKTDDEKTVSDTKTGNGGYSGKNKNGGYSGKKNKDGNKK